MPKPCTKTPQDSAQGLRFTELSYSIDGKTLIDDIDGEISPLGRTVIMGPNGAGKSIFLKLIHGLIEPSIGEVRWGGAPMSDEIRREQAMVFQRPVLLRRSVVDNMNFVRELRPEGHADEVGQWLARVGHMGKEEQPARLLSGGEQQRLALARALLLRPRVLMLDEPTANLDPASVLMIEEIVGEAHEGGMKIIFVTHDLAQARRMGDEIIFMHRGAILEQTGAEEFFKRPRTEAARNFIAGRIIT